MKPLPTTPDLLKVARRVVWFKEPEEALSEPVHFLAHVMTYGTVEDLKALQNVAGVDEFREVLENAPAGVFDAKSWGLLESQMWVHPLPPLPARKRLQLVRPMP